jgi:hypothetical protein
LEERGEALHFPRLFVILFCHEKSIEKDCCKAFCFVGGSVYVWGVVNFWLTGSYAK